VSPGFRSGLLKAAVDLDLGGPRVYAIPTTTRFQGITVRKGPLIKGPAGQGDFCPFAPTGLPGARGWAGTG
jgi:O-succinylbenzoate synthase